MAFLCQDINTLGSSDIDVHVGSLSRCFEDQFMDVFIPSKQLRSQVSRYTMFGLCLQEQFFSVTGKPETDDPYPVAVQKDGLTVGHVLRTIFCIYSVFVRRGGSIVCTITGKRKHSCDLPQGGLVLTPSAVGALLDDFQFLSYCLTWTLCGIWQALGKAW